MVVLPRPFWILIAVTVTLVTSATTKRDGSVLKFRVLEAEVKDFPFRNTSLPWDKRVDDLVSRLTLSEIQEQMARGGAGKQGGPAPAIPRLGIGPYQWDTECLRGAVQEKGAATGFPQAIGLGATFDTELIKRLAVAIGKEVRGKHNDFVKNKIFDSHTGASCFSPVINIARDPRWGRNQETYGEDPYLSGEYAIAYVTGLQGNDSRYVRATGGCKHFDVHGGPENIPVSRLSFNALVTDSDWRTTFLPAFKKCIDAGTYSVMCSYNRINGVPACANKKLLTTILREEWGFKGYVVSDEGAIENIIYKHRYLNNSVDTVAACVNAGCNLELSSNLREPVFSSMDQAIKEKKLAEEMIRERVKPLFYTRMRLGEFDPPSRNPYAKLNSTVVLTPEHQALAVEAAMKSFVLLKNDNSFLPLTEGVHSNVALIGPMADNFKMLSGDYEVVQPRNYTKTPLEALSKVYKNLVYKPACLDKTPCQKYSSDVVKEVVSGADLVFIALGTGVAVEAEGKDRPDLELPGHQGQLVHDVLRYAKPNTTRVVLLLFNAGPLNISFASSNDAIPAIMECFFPAQATGDALVNVLFNRGKNASPAGRLPMTWPLRSNQIPPMINYKMENRTYRYMAERPLYPFGWGLSYTKFLCAKMTVQPPVEPTGHLDVELVVRNTGALDGDEVIQCYVGPEEAAVWPQARSQLAFFTRVHIISGGQTTLKFTITWDAWRYWAQGKWMVKRGVYFVSCGGGQPNFTPPTSNVISVNFEISDSHRADHFTLRMESDATNDSEML